MNKTIVFYKSKFGTSKDYAYWISNTIDCQVFDYSNVTIDKLLQYDTIIFGGDLYTNGINGVSMITRNFKKLKDKKLTTFEFDFSSTDLEDLDNQITEATKVVNKFKGKNGKIDLTIDGAVEAKNVLQTLIDQRNQISNSNNDLFST